MGDTRAELKRAFLDLDMDATVETVRTTLKGAAGFSPSDAVDAIAEALEIVGKRFQDGEWFVGELVYAGEIAKTAMDLLAPALAAGTTERLGTIVVGTVFGDMHDLGKSLFVNFARSSGFEVIDLGVNVDVERFLGAVRAHQPVALGMSCLLTVTAGEVGRIIEALQQNGLRDRVKVIVGGAALTAAFARDVGADAFAPDAVTGTDIVKAWCAA